MVAEALLRASIAGFVGALAVWLICRCVPGLSAAARTWLWWLVALKFALAFALSTSVQIQVLPAASRPEVAPSGAPEPSGWSARELSVAAHDNTSIRSAADATNQPARRTWPISTLVNWLTAFWALGAASALLLQVKNWRQVRAIVATSDEADPEIRATVRRLAAQMRVRRVPTTRTSAIVATPLLIAGPRPVIILPSDTRVPPPGGTQNLAIAHELAHTKRWDLPLGWIPALVESVFFFHPFARLAAREYAVAREAACDALVVQRLRVAPEAYGRMLVDLGVSDSCRGFSLAGASASSAMLKRRLTMLAIAAAPSTPSRAIAATVVFLAALAMVPFQLSARTAVPNPTPETPVAQDVLLRSEGDRTQQPASNHQAPVEAAPPAAVAYRTASTPVRPPSQQESQLSPPTIQLTRADGSSDGLSVLLFDRSALTDAVRSRAVGSALRWVDQMSPDAQAAILSIDTRLNADADFTADKNRLRDALHALEARHVAEQGGAAGIVLTAIKTVCQQMHWLTTPKRLIVLSTGMQRNGPEGRVELDGMEQACNQANVAIVALDARFLSASTADSNPSLSQGAPPGLVNPRFAQTDMVTVDVEVVDESGRFVTGLRPSELRVYEDGVARHVEDFLFVAGSRSYYVLAYRQMAPTATADYHKIEVTTTRAGTHVSARAGYSPKPDSFVDGTYPEGTSGLVGPVVIERRDPTYTSEAIRAKIQGDVVVEAIVGIDGRVTRARIAQSLDSQFGLDDQALKAVQQWTFTAGGLRGEKVPVLVRLILAFRLH